MNINHPGFPSIEQQTSRYFTPTARTQANGEDDGMSFEQVFRQKSLAENQTQRLIFSKHAAGRLADRNIELTASQLERLNDGARKAQAKGIKDSLVIVDEYAFIVNVPNHTVVTAMDSTSADENVFTNINGAVIN